VWVVGGLAEVGAVVSRVQVYDPVTEPMLTVSSSLEAVRS
jgi:hypothetical protein